jgi:hypothetical protein
MLNHSTLLRALAIGFAVILILSCASTNLAQSGRRVRSSTPVQVSTPEPEPSPTPKASSEKPKPRFTFLVGLDRHDLFANIPLYAYDGVLQSLVNRLEDSPVVHVGGTQSDMSRGGAVQKAKAEKEGYVVWLQLQVDTMSSNTQNTTTPDIIIEYSVLAPTTAKQVTSGRTYTQAQRNRGGVLNPRTTGIFGDRYLNLAAQEAADRILAYFRSHGPVGAPPSKQPLIRGQRSEVRGQRSEIRGQRSAIRQNGALRLDTGALEVLLTSDF